MNKLILIFFLFVFGPANSQTNRSEFYGSWYSSSVFGMTFYKFKRNGNVLLFSRGCTNSGRKVNGNWVFQGDSSVTFINDDTLSFRIFNDQLTLSSVAEKGTCETCGLTKTGRQSVLGAQSKWRNEQRKRRRIRRKRNRNN